MTGMGSSTLRLGAPSAGLRTCFAGDSSGFRLQLFANKANLFFQRSLGKSVYCYMLQFSLLAQIFRCPVAIKNGDLLAPSPALSEVERTPSPEV
jgi:hypothetical protein